MADGAAGARPETTLRQGASLRRIAQGIASPGRPPRAHHPRLCSFLVLQHQPRPHLPQRGRPGSSIRPVEHPRPHLRGGHGRGADHPSRPGPHGALPRFLRSRAIRTREEAEPLRHRVGGTRPRHSVQVPRWQAPPGRQPGLFGYQDGAAGVSPQDRCQDSASSPHGQAPGEPACRDHHPRDSHLRSPLSVDADPVGSGHLEPSNGELCTY